MKKIYKYILLTLGISMLLISGCKSEQKENRLADPAMETSAVQTEEETTPAPADIMELAPDSGLFPTIDDVTLPEGTQAIPEYLRVGVEHWMVAVLQSRLMELGFMDNDEPTEYFGNVTEAAVKVFQRQNNLAQDGIVGPGTLKEIMSPGAKYYAVANGVSGDDIARIQQRLYELGYIATSDLVTGNFGDTTEAAVVKLQEVNGLTADGKVGRQTFNLLYSEDIKPNMLSYGEKSDVVLVAQKRLKELGYMTTTPDGAYGDDTIVAVRQFQSRNDQVVDGYLGPSTREVLMSASAQPNGLVLGDQGENVQRVQNLLNKLGYLASSKVTGYYGEMTENAVKAFQSRNGLSADGSVGMKTMAVLTSENAKKPAPNTSSGSTGSSGGSQTSGSSSSGGSSGGSGTTPGTYSGGGAGAGALIAIAQSKLGCPYVWGAKGSNSFDCSGFVYWCLNQAGVRQSYITSSGWRNVGKYTRVNSFSELQAGDIVVVSGHVGIAAGGGQVIDASSSNGRVVQRSLSSWWQNNFICGWRIW